MVYKNDLSKLIEARNKNIFSYMGLVLISLFVVSISIKITLEDSSLRFLVIVLTVFLGLLSGILGVFYRQKIFKKKIESYEVQVDDNSITIIEKSYSQKLELKQIKFISVLKDGSLVIKKNFLKIIKLSPYLEKKDEIKEILENKGIDNKKQVMTYYLQFAPFVIYLALMLQRLFNNYLYYLIVGSLFVFTGIYTIIQIVIYGRKRIAQIPIIVFWGYLTYIVAKNLFKIVSYLIS
jgi:hypothetical protein